MKNNTEKTLKKLLIAAVAVNLLLLVLQLYNTRITINNTRQSLITLGQATLSTFEGGRRAMMALSPEYSGYFKQYLAASETNTAVKSIYLFSKEKGEILNTGNINPPFTEFAEDNGIYENKEGIFLYRHLKHRPAHGMGMGMGMFSHRFKGEDMPELVGAVLIDTRALKSVKRSESTFFLGVLLLQALLTSVFLYSLKVIKSSEENTRLLELQDREAQMGRMSLVMAHELKNPLSSVKGLLEFSAKKSEGTQKEIAQRSVEELSRLDRIINDFLTFGRDMTPETCDTDIFSLAEDTAMLLQLDAGSKNLILNIKGGHTVIQADPSKMKQVLFNLMLNAVQAAPENSEITVSVNRHSLKIVNEIKDADFDRTKIGTPFYTTKTVGTGLGLAIVNRILTLHGFGLKITADKSFIAEITF